MAKHFRGFVRLVEQGMLAKGYSARQLAIRVGTSASYVTRMLGGERNPPSDEILRRMAKELDVDEAQLFLLADRLPGFMRTTGPVTQDQADALKNFWKIKIAKKQRRRKR